MKAMLRWVGALVITVLTVSLAQANPYFDYPYIRQAPDACGQGYYCVNYCGAPYGPNYCVRPAWAPFNGFRPCLDNSSSSGQGGRAGYPVHPFARSPRDYFMIEK